MATCNKCTAPCLLIDKECLFLLTPMNSFVDTKEINIAIENAQDLYLQNPINEIYEAICLEIETEGSIDACSTATKEILEQLKKPLAWFAYYEWLTTFGSGKPTAKGYTRTSQNTVEGEDSANFLVVSKRMKEKAEKYWAEFVIWFTANRTAVVQKETPFPFTVAGLTD